MDPAATNYNPLATQDDGTCTYTPPPVGACNDLGQLTPNYSPANIGGAADINYATSVSQAVASVISQDPYGFWAGNEATWNSVAYWDGVPMDVSGWPTSPTTAQLAAFIYPDSNHMRGLHQHFYNINPFADNTAPTVEEIDQWNVEVIRHLRKLVGNTTPVGGSRCLFLRAQWNEEKHWSTIWDSPPYDGWICPHTGPVDPHCGAAFIPNAADQLPYLDQMDDVVCSQKSGAEGMSTINTNIPWSIKLARTIALWIQSEGMTGHAGPYFTRECFGCCFHVLKYSPATTGYRGKFNN
jgi:hypothetical protein